MLRTFILSALSILPRATIFFPPLALKKLDGTIGSMFTGVSDNEESGNAVAGIGDFNGDGLGDVVIGAPFASPDATRTSAGSCYVVFGSNTSYGASFGLSGLNGMNGFRINGVASNDFSCGSVSSAGDLNHDGLSDLIIGAVGAAPGNRSFAGSSFVVFGSRNPFNATFELSTLNGINGFRINGVSPADRSGGSVGSAGDVNKDGFDDVAIGAYFASPSPLRNFAGSTFIVFGSNIPFNPVLELSTLNGTNGVRINGVSSSDWSGGAVASTDINGDGYSDLFIGASKASPAGKSNAGSIFVVFGTNKTFNATFELSTLNGTNGFRIDGLSANDKSGVSLARAGNVNGFGGVIIGASGGSPGGRVSAGSSFVFYGGSTFNAIVSLSTLNGTNGFRINGEFASDASGSSVSAAGDVNGDGIIDYLIGAPFAYQDGVPADGRSYVVFGTNQSMGSTIELSALDGIIGFKIYGGISANEYSGSSVAGAGDVNGDGVGDFVVGAYAGSPPGFVGAGISCVVFGDYIAWENNALTISGGGSKILTASDLNVSVPDSVGYTQYYITDPQHVSFAYVDQPNVQITQFNGLDVRTGRVNVTHDDSELAPSYFVTADHTLAEISPYPAAITFINQLPIVENKTLIINQGETKLVDNTTFWVIDPDNAQHNAEIVIKILGSANGFFSNSIFSQQQLWNGEIYYTQSNSILPPQYTFTIYLGGYTSTPYVPTIDFDTIPVLVNNHFAICQNQTEIVTTNMLSANHPGFNSSDALVFSVQNLQYGYFINALGITSVFSQAQIKNNSIQFVQDGSSNAPNFMFTIEDNNRTTTPLYFAGVYFTKAPIIMVNTLIVNQGQRIVFTDNMLYVVDPNVFFEDLVITVSDVKQGMFTVVNTTQNITQFNKSQLNAGEIAFEANDSPFAPSYSVFVDNGCARTASDPASVQYNSKPVLTSNQLTLVNLQPAFLTSALLSAFDAQTPFGELVFTVVDAQNIYFDAITLPGTPIKVFTQQMVFGGTIRAVPTNNGTPSYNVSVSDGILSSGPEEALVSLTNTSTTTVINNYSQDSNTATASDTIRNTLISFFSVTVPLGLAWFVIRRYVEKRMDNNMKAALSVNSSAVEKADTAWRENTIAPVLKEVFSRSIQTATGCCGYRDGETTLKYVGAIEKLLGQLKEKGVPVNLNEYVDHERGRFKNAIVEEIRIRAEWDNPPKSGVSRCLSTVCSASVRPVFRASELDKAASQIASVIAETYNKGLSELEIDKIRRRIYQRPKYEQMLSAPIGRRQQYLELLDWDKDPQDREQKSVSVEVIQGLIMRLEQLEQSFASLESKRQPASFEGAHVVEVGARGVMENSLTTGQAPDPVIPVQRLTKVAVV